MRKQSSCLTFSHHTLFLRQKVFSSSSEVATVTTKSSTSNRLIDIRTLEGANMFLSLEGGPNCTFLTEHLVEPTTIRREGGNLTPEQEEQAKSIQQHTVDRATISRQENRLDFEYSRPAYQVGYRRTLGSLDK